MHIKLENAPRCFRCRYITTIEIFFNFIGFDHIPFDGIVALTWNLNSCTITSFINVFEQILDCTNVVADLNIDVCIVFGWQIDIVRYHPTIVQFNAMNQKCVPHISTLINRISVYIRHCLELEFVWILLSTFAFFHAWMHLETHLHMDHASCIWQPFHGPTCLFLDSEVRH